MNRSELLQRRHAGRDELADCWRYAIDEQKTRLPGPQQGWSVKHLIAHLTSWEWPTLDLLTVRTLTASPPALDRDSPPWWPGIPPSENDITMPIML